MRGGHKTGLKNTNVNFLVAKEQAIMNKTNANLIELDYQVPESTKVAASSKNRLRQIGAKEVQV